MDEYFNKLTIALLMCIIIRLASLFNFIMYNANYLLEQRLKAFPPINCKVNGTHSHRRLRDRHDYQAGTMIYIWPEIELLNPLFPCP
jgi:hypothetical protein